MLHILWSELTTFFPGFGSRSMYLCILYFLGSSWDAGSARGVVVPWRDPREAAARDAASGRLLGLPEERTRENIPEAKVHQ